MTSETVTPEIQMLAKIGGNALAILAFTAPWNSETPEKIKQAALTAGIEISDKQAVRELCAAGGIDISNIDTTPTLEFSFPVPIVPQVIREAFNRYHDSKAADHRVEDELETADALIDELFKVVGISINY